MEYTTGVLGVVLLISIFTCQELKGSHRRLCVDPERHAFSSWCLPMFSSLTRVFCEEIVRHTHTRRRHTFDDSS